MLGLVKLSLQTLLRLEIPAANIVRFSMITSLVMVMSPPCAPKRKLEMLSQTSVVNVEFL